MLVFFFSPFLLNVVMDSNIQRSSKHDKFLIESPFHKVV